MKQLLQCVGGRRLQVDERAAAMGITPPILITLAPPTSAVQPDRQHGSAVVGTHCNHATWKPLAASRDTVATTP
jgi:hypothetical protein